MTAEFTDTDARGEPDAASRHDVGPEPHWSWKTRKTRRAVLHHIRADGLPRERLDR
jgi:hypothetical protein